MFKIFLRVFLILILLITFTLLYLSVFGIKTKKFNELIRSQVSNLDNRLHIDLKDVFFKINIKERSFSLNSKDIKIFVLKESQEIANVDLLIGLESVINKDIKINKIIVNSKKNEIVKLLKFIRTYKLNIPALYLENNIANGDIVYDIFIKSNNNYLDEIKINGKITDTNLSIFGRENLEDVDLNFDYTKQRLKINNLKLKYKKINFQSKNIIAKINNNLVNLKGDLKNKVNLNLISNFINFDFKNYINEKILLNSTSNFDISLSRNFKLINYNLDSEIEIEDINVALKNTNIKNYIKDFDDKIILKNGKLRFKTNGSNNTSISIISKYILTKDQDLKDFSLNYTEQKSFEKYHFYVDLSENELSLDEINFSKKANQEMFLNLEFVKNKNTYEIKNLKLFNDNNLFNLNNIKLLQNFKIIDFSFIEANFYNKNELKNDILLKKKNNDINITSKNFDISENIEKILNRTSKSSLLDIFQSLNSSLYINIQTAKLDNEHNLKNVEGEVFIINNKIDKANLFGSFENGKKFTYTKDDFNEKKVTTIYSDIAKPFVKKFKFIRGFEDGKLDYTSTEINNDQLNSELRIYDFKLKDMPVLTKLLSLASLQGIADLATGEGIRFNEFDMYFENSKNLIRINEIYAIGPAISILMEGYIEKNNLVSLRGTMVPATTINKTISKIPLLGEILVGKKMGEGVFGVSFKIKGPPNDLKTTVNPIKTLTPRFITRTLEKIKKTN